MQAVHAKWKDGRVCIDGPINWPDGINLVVRPINDEVEDFAPTQIEPLVDGDEIPFSAADVESTDPAAIARWAKEWKSIPPLELSDAEYEEMLTQRRAQRDFDLQNFEHRVGRLIREELDG